MLKESKKNSPVNAIKVFSSTRIPWSKNTKQVDSLISSIDEDRVVDNSEKSLLTEAEEDVELSVLFESLLGVSRDETRSAVVRFRNLFDNLERYTTIKCTFNRMLLKARVELESTDKRRESLEFRATNALHLTGSEFELDRKISFEATVVEDGIILTGLSGFYVRLSVLKGEFRRSITQMRIIANGDDCRMKLTTHNPLIENAEEANSLIELETDFKRLEGRPDRKEMLEQRTEGARKLRKTYNDLKALDAECLSKITMELPALRPVVYECAKRTLKLKFTETQKNFLSLYAMLLILTSLYFWMGAHVAILVPISMALSAVSILMICAEASATFKSAMALCFNFTALSVIVIKLIQLC